MLHYLSCTGWSFVCVYFMKTVLKYFTFFNGLFIFLLRYCLYILDTSLLQDVYFTSSFI